MTRVGIVNDVALVAEALRRIVGATPGFSVAWIARDGEEGVAMAASDRPDMILMDLVMPVMDGAALIRSLHKMGAQVRFLAVSGLVEREKVLVATTAPGAQVEFLAKPFATEKLLNLVREVLLRPVPDAS